MKFSPLHNGLKGQLKLVCLKVALSAGILCSVSILLAQPNPDLVPLFSRNSISGTARSAGIAGAFGSVGADLSSLDINPAGLGLYRSSDICVTPALRIAHDNAAYDGTTTGGTHPSFEFAQVGFAFTKLYASSGNHNGMSFDSHPLRSITFAINFQRDAFFSRTQNFNSPGNNNSLVTNYANLAGNFQSPFFSYESAMLFYAGMLNNTANASNYYSRVYGPVQQAGSILTRGGIDKISLGLGGNIQDKLYFGFGFSVPILNYTVSPQMTETEINPNDSSINFPTYQLASTYNESGFGVTGNLGLIYKPVAWARFGVAYALPTWYFLTENFSSSLSFSEDSAGGQYQGSISTQDFSQTPPSISYRLRTPMKGTVSASFFLKEHGFISVDYEFQNIGSTRFSFPDTTYMSPGSDTAYNHYIKSTYTFSHTIRVGVEGAINIVRLRAGYSYSSTPFHAGQAFTKGYDEQIHGATCGIGIRLKNFYADLAYVFNYSKDAISPTGFQIPFDQVNSKYMTHTISLTIGWKISKSASNNNTRKKAPVNNYSPPPAVDPGDRY